MIAVLIVLLIAIFFLMFRIYIYKQKLKRVVIEEAGEWERAESNNEIKKILAIWLKKRMEGKYLNKYFEERNIKQIAIYGMAELGVLLYEELKTEKVEVVYGIDRKEKLSNLDIPIMKPKDIKEENVDAIVVTPVYYFGEIYDFLNKIVKDSVQIIGIDEILYSLDEK